MIQALIVRPLVMVLRPSGRYCAELKPTLAWYWYQPVTDTTMVGEMEGAEVKAKLGGTFPIGIEVGVEVDMQVGEMLGKAVGTSVGVEVSSKVGQYVGVSVGIVVVGESVVGSSVGAKLGLDVGTE